MPMREYYELKIKPKVETDKLGRLTGEIKFALTVGMYMYDDITRKRTPTKVIISTPYFSVAEVEFFQSRQINKIIKSMLDTFLRALKNNQLDLLNIIEKKSSIIIRQAETLSNNNVVSLNIQLE